MRNYEEDYDRKTQNSPPATCTDTPVHNKMFFVPP
jgi:hypothetical protein